MGFRLAAYPHADLSGGFRDETALSALQSGTAPEQLLSFSELKDLVGFPAYDQAANSK